MENRVKAYSGHAPEKTSMQPEIYKALGFNEIGEVIFESAAGDKEPADISACLTRGRGKGGCFIVTLKRPDEYPEMIAVQEIKASPGRLRVQYSLPYEDAREAFLGDDEGFGKAIYHSRMLAEMRDKVEVLGIEQTNKGDACIESEGGLEEAAGCIRDIINRYKARQIWDE